jgi:hypothetical protein
MLDRDQLSAGPAKERLREIQHEILEATALGHRIEDVMDLLCRRIEELDSEIICSVLSVDPSGRLHPLAAPRLPADYSAALDGVAIGPCVGSCGTSRHILTR